jgi:hypothetical protein
VNPLEVRLPGPDEVSGSGRFDIDVEIRNHSESRLRNLVATLYAAEDCLRIVGPESHRRGVLREDASVSVKWQLQVAPATQCEAAIVLASVAVTDSDGEVVTQESTAKVITIR